MYLHLIRAVQDAFVDIGHTSLVARVSEDKFFAYIYVFISHYANALIGMSVARALCGNGFIWRLANHFVGVLLGPTHLDAVMLIKTFIAAYVHTILSYI